MDINCVLTLCKHFGAEEKLDVNSGGPRVSPLGLLGKVICLIKGGQ